MVKVVNNAISKDYSYKEIGKTLKEAKKNGLKEAEIFESIDKMGVLTLKLNETSININPKLTIPENAEIYYEKAKKAEKAVKGITDYIGTPDENDINKLKQAIRMYDSLSSSERNYFDRNVYETARRMLAEAEEDQRERERRRKRRDDDDYFGGGGYHGGSSSFGSFGGGGISNGGGASRGF